MKKHRGLSAVIGAVFLVAVLIGALSYVTYTMNVLGNFSESLITEEKRQKDKQGEQFEISSLSSVGNKLDGVVKNTGDIPLEIKRVWIEETGNPNSVKKFDVNEKISPGNKINLINSVDFDIDSTKGYSLKMVSSRGQIQTSYLNSASSAHLFMNVNVIPKTIVSGFPTTVIFTVVNNMSNNNILYNLTPEITVSTDGLSTYALVSGASPQSYPVLKPGDIATFEYIYTITGSSGQYVNFGLNLQNGYLINANHYQSVNATVAVKDVELALSAGSAITSLGLETVDSIATDLLVLHDENYAIPVAISGGTQMQNRAPDTGGTTFNTYNNNPRLFVGANMSQQLTVYPGKWNASLQYYSNATSVNLPTPSFAFFFECDNCPTSPQTAESIGYIDSNEVGKGQLIKDGTTLPTWRDPTNPLYGDGPDKDGYYNFVGTGGLLRNNWKAENGPTTTIGSPPDTDSVWVRVNSGTIANYMPLISYTDKKDPTKADNYEISIGDPSNSLYKGQIRFYVDESKKAPGSAQVSCIYSTGPKLNLAPYLSKWQHIVAVRESNGQCTLYLNGSKVLGPSGSGGSSVDGIKDVAIGSHIASSGDPDAVLKADVASWIHWNDKALTASQAKELFYTNYGNNGTRVHLTINKTDTNGANNVLIVDVPNYSLPFYDPAKKSAAGVSYSALYSDALSTAINKYSHDNVTANMASQYTFQTGDRLVLGIKTDSTNQNLPIYIKTDDTDFPGSTVATFSPFLQSPATTIRWPGFLSFATTAKVSIDVFNDGPTGIWLQFTGTRMVLTSNDAQVSYGAMPTGGNANGVSFTLTPQDDSVYVPDQGTVQIDFEELHNPPSIPTGGAGTRVVAGDYLASIYLSGYDEAGSAFLRTIDLGVVHIY